MNIDVENKEFFLYPESFHMSGKFKNGVMPSLLSYT